MVNQGCLAKSLDSYNPLISAAIWVNPLLSEDYSIFHWTSLLGQFRLMENDVSLKLT